MVQLTVVQQFTITLHETSPKPSLYSANMVVIGLEVYHTLLKRTLISPLQKMFP